MKTMRVLARAYDTDPYVRAFLDAVSEDVAKGVHPLAAFLRETEKLTELRSGLEPPVAQVALTRVKKKIAKKASTVRKAKTVETKALVKKRVKRATNGSGRRMKAKAMKSKGLPITRKSTGSSPTLGLTN